MENPFKMDIDGYFWSTPLLGYFRKPPSEYPRMDFSLCKAMRNKNNVAAILGGLRAKRIARCGESFWH